MSKRATYKTSMNDIDSLVCGLEEVYGSSSVTHAGEEVSVKVKGTYSPARFHKNKDNVYEVEYDEMDRNAYGKLFPETVNGQVVNRLAQAYSKALVIKTMKSLRGSVIKNSVDQNDVINIRIKTVQY